VLLPGLYSLFVITRVFVILPKLWIRLEDACDWIVFHMGSEPAYPMPGTKGSTTHPFFTRGPRRVAEKSGQDLGVFRTFHPTRSARNDDLPAEETAGLYWLLSTALLYDLFFETVPQLVIQIVNNSELNLWSTFTWVSLIIGLLTIGDDIRNQVVEVLCKGKTFGSKESWQDPQDGEDVPRSDPGSGLFSCVKQLTATEIRQLRLDKAQSVRVQGSGSTVWTAIAQTAMPKTKTEDSEARGCGPGRLNGRTTRAARLDRNNKSTHAKANDIPQGAAPGMDIYGTEGFAENTHDVDGFRFAKTEVENFGFDV
jgi:hypothetical protein